MRAFEAVCRFVLGDTKNAIKLARNCVLEESADAESKVGMAILLMFLGKQEDREFALNVLEKQNSELTETKNGVIKNEQLVALILARNQGISALCECWEKLYAQMCSNEVLYLGASWIFQMLGYGEPAQDGVRDAFPRNVERFIRKKLVSQADVLEDFFLASAGLSFEEAHKRGVSFEGRVLEPAVLYNLRQVEMHILAQRNQFAQLQHALQEKRDTWIRTHPTAYSDALAATAFATKRRIPLLTLKFFGGFEVLIGDIPLDSANFKRHNCRLLLVLLALNNGKEVARDRVAAAMWPDSEPKGAQKNFYTVWAQLRKVLTLEDGTCPYLIRQQYGCSLDMRYVQSDLVRHGEICRELLFGKPDVVPWANLFTEIDRDFSGDLLPSEHANQTILAARAEYRSRLIDALVAAAGTIIETDHPEWGIWFARAALRHDETREDAWLALMKGQVACSQRTAAMMTYLKCRAILDERLGIDPSYEAESLYTDLLNGEVPLFVK